jgi:hypothetical protein
MQYPHRALLFARSSPGFGVLNGGGLASVPGQAPPGRLVLTVWSVKIFASGLVLLSPPHRSTAVS